MSPLLPPGRSPGLAGWSPPTATATSPEAARSGVAGLPPDRLLLTHRQRPFSPLTVARELPAGLTLAEIVALAIPDPTWQPHAAVLIGDDPEPIDRALWHRVRPRAGQRVQVAVLPQAGGNMLRTVLMLAVVVVALVAAPYLAPAFMGAGGVAAVGAALSIGGMLAVNALVPPVQPKADTGAAATPTSYSLTGGSNRPRMWEAIPRVLGYHRMAPDVAAPWVTDVEGDKSYLCGLLSFGYGPLDIEDIRIGESPIDDFDEVQLQMIAGHKDEVANFTLYPNIIVPLAVSTRLSRSTGFVSRTTAPETDQAVIELALPNGGYRAGSDPGERVGISVSFEVESQEVFEDGNLGDRVRHANHRIDAKTQATKRSTIRIYFPRRGQFRVHVRRTTADTDEDDEKQRVDESWWIALRSHRNEVPIRRAGLCLMAIRVRATEQFNNVIDNLTAVIGSYGPHYDGSIPGYVNKPTAQPSALFRLILQGNGQKNPVPDSKIDFAALEAWANHCFDHKLTCNVVLDQGISTWEALRLVCATANAAPTCATGTWSVVLDRSRPYQLQQFTPRNSRGFKGRRLFVDLPHALRCKFINAAKDFEDDERIVYDDGYNRDNAAKFESVEFPGVTDAEQIYKLARRRIAEARLRSETYELETSWDWLSSTRGDRVGVASDVTEWGADSFRIKELVMAGSLLTAIVLDGSVTLEASQAYDISIRGYGDSPYTYQIQPSDEPSGTMPLLSPAVPPPDLRVNDLVTVGARGIVTHDCLIHSIVPGPELSARINLIPYHEGVYLPPDATIPEWTSGRTRSPGIDQPKILGVRSGESAGKRNADGSLFVRVLVALYDDGSRPLTVIAGVELRWREVDSGAPWNYMSFPADAREIAILEAEDNTTIELACRYTRRDGKTTSWTPPLTHFVDGPDVPPPNVGSIYIDGDRLSWTVPVPRPPDLAGYRLSWNSTAGQPADAAMPFSDGLATDTFVPLGSVPDSAVEMLVVAVTSAGLESPIPARCAIAPGVLPTRVELARLDLRAGSGSNGPFFGARVNCQIDVNGDLVATDTSQFLSPITARFLEPKTGLWLAASWSAMTYEAVYPVPVLAREGDRVRLDMEYEGALQLYYAWGGDALTTWPPEIPITEPMWDYAKANPQLVFGQILGGAEAASGSFVPGVSIPGVFAPGVYAAGVYPLGVNTPGSFEVGTSTSGVFEPGVFQAGVFVPRQSGVAVSTRGLRPWRTAISVRPGEALRVQVRSQGGSGIRPRITRFQLVLEGPEVEEQVSNFVVAATGSKLPLTKRFRRIEWVFGIPRADGSSQGRTPAFVTKDLPEGPIVQFFNPAGIAVQGVGDWRVGGV